MKKSQKIAAVCVAVLLIVGLGFIANAFAGNPLSAALARRTAEGDAAAAACFAEFGTRLHDALEPFLRGYRPECLCLGGQITRSFAMFGTPLQELCRELGITVHVAADTSVLAMQGLCTL